MYAHGQSDASGSSSSATTAITTSTVTRASRAIRVARRHACLCWARIAASRRTSAAPAATASCASSAAGLMAPAACMRSGSASSGRKSSFGRAPRSVPSIRSVMLERSHSGPLTNVRPAGSSTVPPSVRSAHESIARCSRLVSRWEPSPSAEYGGCVTSQMGPAWVNPRAAPGTGWGSSAGENGAAIFRRRRGARLRQRATHGAKSPWRRS